MEEVLEKNDLNSEMVTPIEQTTTDEYDKFKETPESEAKRIENALKFAIKVYPKVKAELDSSELMALFEPIDFLILNTGSDNSLVNEWEAYTLNVRKDLIRDDMVSFVQKDGSITFHIKGPNYSEKNKKDILDLDPETQLKLDTYQAFKETLLFSYMTLMVDCCKYYYDLKTPLSSFSELEKKLLDEIKEYDEWALANKDTPLENDPIDPKRATVALEPCVKVV